MPTAHGIISTTSKDHHAAYLAGGADGITPAIMPGIETTEAGINATSFKAFPIR